jgi:hypothetical protein
VELILTDGVDAAMTTYNARAANPTDLPPPRL